METMKAPTRDDTMSAILSDGLLLDPCLSMAPGYHETKADAAKASEPAGKTVKPAIDVLHEWDEELVAREYLHQKPFVLRGVVDHWPAMEWSFESMEENYGDARCWVHRYQPKENSSYAVQSIQSYCTRRSNMTIRKFLQDFFNKEDSKGTKWSIKECSHIFEQYPDLEYHLFFENFLPSSLQGREKQTETFLWMGNPGSSTGLHTDLIDWNINLQISGRKVWKFYSPEDTQFLYKESESPLQGGEYSPVDPFDVNHIKYPKFRNATEYEIMVGPGDIVYVPDGWWHAEQSLNEPTMNVSYAIGEPAETWASWYEGARLMASHYLYAYGELVESVVDQTQPLTKAGCEIIDAAVAKAQPLAIGDGNEFINAALAQSQRLAIAQEMDSLKEELKGLQ